MRILLFRITLTLVCTSWASATWAAEVLPNAKTSPIIHSWAHPDGARVPNATHHFELKVEENALSQLSIDIPKGIRVTRGIETTTKSGQKLDATVSINNRRAAIAFAQPVPPGTIVSVSMKGIRTSDYLGRTWFYLVRGRNVGMTSDIPLGTVRIQTYK